MPAKDGDPRLTFQEVMEMDEVPSADPTSPVKRYISRTPAWLPGADIPFGDKAFGPGRPLPITPVAAFGAHVYCGAALAAVRAVRAAEARAGVPPPARSGLHTVHGYFTRMGRPGAPYVFDVSPGPAARSFRTASVTARQPERGASAATNDNDDNTTAATRRFRVADADGPLAEPPCFVAMCSLRPPEPRTAAGEAAEPPPQTRFAEILGSRAPEAWRPSPPLDVDGVVRLDDALVGTFPGVDMKKVDMSAFNAGRPLYERRELILYRLLAPLPVREEEEEEKRGKEGQGDGANLHVLLHAYEADRNGLLMEANHLGYGHEMGIVASLSYSFIVHENAEDAIMTYSESMAVPGLEGLEKGEWWIQEASFPRAARGRAVILNKIWSPRGVHVATGYQDGLCRSAKEKGRL